MNSYQTSKWEWVALEDAVEICDYLRKPVNSKERAQRVTNKREDELYPYYGGKLGLGLNDIRDAKVPVVSDEQAKTIVFEISGRLSVCDSIEQTIDTSLQKAEAMRQSILKQAFEGRL